MRDLIILVSAKYWDLTFCSWKVKDSCFVEYSKPEWILTSYCFYVRSIFATKNKQTKVQSKQSWQKWSPFLKKKRRTEVWAKKHQGILRQVRDMVARLKRCRDGVNWVYSMMLLLNDAFRNSSGTVCCSLNRWNFWRDGKILSVTQRSSQTKLG